MFVRKLNCHIIVDSFLFFSVFCCPWHVRSSDSVKFDCIEHLDLAVNFILANKVESYMSFYLL